MGDVIADGAPVGDLRLRWADAAGWRLLELVPCPIHLMPVLDASGERGWVALWRACSLFLPPLAIREGGLASDLGILSVGQNTRSPCAGRRCAYPRCSACRSAPSAGDGPPPAPPCGA